MPDLADGETAQVEGSRSNVYTLTNTGGVYSCTCPAWKHQSIPIERRTCKHLRKYRGDAAEVARLGSATALSGRPAGSPVTSDADAPPVLLAHKWEEGDPVAGWWMSEKLDGVRAWWDGKQFLSRGGNVFHAPDWFVTALPKHPLDGELWGGRKLFQKTSGIVRRHDKSDQWKKLRYMVFDAPEQKGEFEARLEHLRKTIPRDHDYVATLGHELCRDRPHLDDEFTRVEGLGGEGLMLRRPGSLYVSGRSETLLKVKRFHDMEARVLDHAGGSGKHKGRLGALVAELPDGTKFNIGTGFTDAEREDPPQIGSVVTFRYQELTDGGVPRFPSFVRERPGFAWPAGGGATPAKKTAKKTAPAPKPAAASKPKAPANKKAAKTGPTAPGATATSPAPASAARYFEYVGGGSSKFWEITVAGDSFTTRYGKIGSDGQSKTKSFDSPAKASAAADKLVSQKTAKGYVEQ